MTLVTEQSSDFVPAPPARRLECFARSIALRFPSVVREVSWVYRSIMLARAPERQNEWTAPFFGRSLQEDMAKALDEGKIPKPLLKFCEAIAIRTTEEKYALPDGHISYIEQLKPVSRSDRSIIFVTPSYYHYYYLAEALKARGWHAVTICIEPLNSGNRRYYHGQDYNIWHDDPLTRRAMLFDLMASIEANFKMMCWHGEAVASLFPENWQPWAADKVPWDFLELKRKGVKLASTISGCLTGQRQSSFNRVSGGVCNKCIWQNNGEVCGEARTARFEEIMTYLPDLFMMEIDWPGAKSRTNKKCIQEPLSYCLDPDIWRPDLVVPEEMKLERKPGQILVWHAVGNYDTRAVGQRNIKGTGAVIRAIDRLKSEGWNVELVFRTNIPSVDMKYYQVQVDIVVDQLNYGRYGASAREAMALGRPTICKLDPIQPNIVPPSLALAECPLVNADEETVYDALLMLIKDEALRIDLGKKSRDYAVKWHGMHACAERFERVYDLVMAKKDLRKFAS
jgi:hypothetical protein